MVDNTNPDTEEEELTVFRPLLLLALLLLLPLFLADLLSSLCELRCRLFRSC